MIQTYVLKGEHKFGGLCKRGLHSLDLPDGQNKQGRCRICYNEYLNTYRREKRREKKRALAEASALPESEPGSRPRTEAL
jgi:hypothetical protein